MRNLLIVIVGTILLLPGVDSGIDHRQVQVSTEIVTNIDQPIADSQDSEDLTLGGMLIPFQIVSEGVDVIRASRGHQYGMTGEDVRVAVIDLGFDITNEEISKNVVEFREFTGDGLATEDKAHGTAVAEIVVDTAPNVDLYLYRVDGPRTFLAAIDASVEAEVDILSISIGFINLGPYDGTSSVSLALDKVRELGILPVVAAGNFGRNHWSGSYRDIDQDGVHEFTEEGETNFLNVTRDDLIQLELSWDDWPIAERDYDLFLLDPESIVVASSTNDQSGNSIPPVESVSYVARSTGSYSIEIRSSKSVPPVTSGLDFFHIFSTTHNLKNYVEEGSIGNLADSKGALTVGASSINDDLVEPFSSKGPTSDGRIKPDLVAPNAVSVDSLASPFRGTSPSAPYVAGLAALLLETNRDLTPDDIQILLEASAKDLDAKGKDNLSGAGRTELRFLLLRSEREVLVDGESYPSEDLPHAFVWPLGSSHSLFVSPLVDIGAGERQRFVSWSDGARNPVREFAYDLTLESLAAEFSTEFFLNIDSPFGVVTGGGWSVNASEVQLTITSEEEYGNGTRVTFVGWKGDFESTNDSISILVESAIQLEAVWAVQYFIEVQGNGGDVSGEGWYGIGDLAIVEAFDPTSLDQGSRLRFVGWIGDIISNESSLTVEVNQPMKLGADWQAQFFLRIVSTVNNVEGEKWYDADEIATFSVEPRQGFLGQSVFAGWTGDSSSTTSSSSILMDSAKTVEAVWRTDYSNLIMVGGISSTVFILGFISLSRRKRSSS